MDTTVYIECGIALFFLICLFVEIFYLYVYPLFRMRGCKIGDVYYKNKKHKNPFEPNKNIRKEYIVLDIKDGYVKYENVYISTDGKDEFRRGWVHTCSLYSFFCYIVQGYKNKK